MGSFLVEGGRRLKGTITPMGAKNEALQIICASLLTPEEVIVSNVPDIADIRNLLILVEEMGVKVKHLEPHTVSLQAKDINFDFFQTDTYKRLFRSLRGAVMLIGPLLARYGKAYFPKPGGDKIGRRRLDTHFIGWHKLGVEFEYDSNSKLYILTAPKGIKSNFILLDEASVTGTANIIMSSVFAPGETTIYNAACEPYVQQLCRMLQKMGVKISGIGSNLLKITGVSELSGVSHTLLPDMIEVGSFIGMAAMTGSDILLKNVGIKDLGIMPSAFSRLGVNIMEEDDDIHIVQEDIYEIATFMDKTIMTFADAPWPGLSPDLLSIFLVVATQAKGSVLIHQKMFESRLFFVDKLIDMGASIILCDPHRAAVIGSGKFNSLHATDMVSPDIRAGIAMLIAALSAKGTSRIQNIIQIDRGYERIDERLNAIGANIIRVED